MYVRPKRIPREHVDEPDVILLIVRSEMDENREARGKDEAERSRGKKGEKGGHKLSERNNISPEDLFTWRETLPLVSHSGSLPWESFIVVDVKSINLLR